ncbi:MAG TPA: hypothetical protein VM901_13075 [Bdellovibrionota bacterium]|jgi:hypothetical protein|nr:hypothetical protein [Bdellovibrionota bacterium]
MTFKRKFLLAMLAIAGFFVVQLAIRSKLRHENVKATIRAQAQSKMVLPIAAMAESAKVDGQELKNVIFVDLPKLVDEMPRDEKILEEVKQSVHSVPSSLMDFTVLVSKKMKQARDNYFYAEALFSEFDSCAAQDDERNITLRAYCLANAKRLVTWYPNLAARWTELAERVGTHVLELVDLGQG